MIITIDPGTSDWCGVAVWEDSGVLRSAYRVRPETLSIHVATWHADGCVPLHVETPHAVRGNARARDVIMLAVFAGRLLGTRGTAWTPESWKGQIPKPKRRGRPYIVWERCKRILTPEEVERVQDPTSWDCVDAVGLGLVVVGRAKRGLR